MQDRHVTVRELAEEVGISAGSVHSILPDGLAMRSVRDAWQLHYDNAAAHSGQLIQTFLAEHNILVVLQAPYSPDMTPCDFWRYPHLKTPLKGTRFESSFRHFHRK
jgi:8-oxo-dGTP pyrophosphatase MutT (NUDIX family)